MVYMFLAEGFEEIEALCPLDLLRRAGVEITTVGVGSKTVMGAHGIGVVADMTEDELYDFSADMIILPGGMPGTLNLEKSPLVQSFIDYCVENKKMIAAICAAPSILGHKGLLNGKKAVCFPGFEEQLAGAEILNSAVVTDGNIITGCGAGAALEFGFEIVKYIQNEAAANHFRKAMLCDR